MQLLTYRLFVCQGISSIGYDTSVCSDCVLCQVGPIAMQCAGEPRFPFILTVTATKFAIKLLHVSDHCPGR